METITITWTSGFGSTSRHMALTVNDDRLNGTFAIPMRVGSKLLVIGVQS